MIQLPMLQQVLTALSSTTQRCVTQVCQQQGSPSSVLISALDSPAEGAGWGFELSAFLVRVFGCVRRYTFCHVCDEMFLGVSFLSVSWSLEWRELINKSSFCWGCISLLVAAIPSHGFVLVVHSSGSLAVFSSSVSEESLNNFIPMKNHSSRGDREVRTAFKLRCCACEIVNIRNLVVNTHSCFAKLWTQLSSIACMKTQDALASLAYTWQDGRRSSAIGANCLDSWLASLILLHVVLLMPSWCYNWKHVLQWCHYVARADLDKQGLAPDHLYARTCVLCIQLVTVGDACFFLYYSILMVPSEPSGWALALGFTVHACSVLWLHGMKTWIVRCMEDFDASHYFGFRKSRRKHPLLNLCAIRSVIVLCSWLMG